MPRPVVNITGRRFGRLLALRREGKLGTKAAWRCQCDCGNEVIVRGTSLRGAVTESCGCLQIDRVKAANIKEFHSNSPEYRAWGGMKSRCTNPDVPSYPRYGGRGIRVCARWLKNFQAFRRDMGPRPTSEHSLDRIDNEGDYTPQNCRWATKSEQAQNRTNSIRIEYEGLRLSVQDWAEKLSIPVGRIHNRLAAGWSDPAEILFGSDHHNSTRTKR